MFGITGHDWIGHLYCKQLHPLLSLLMFEIRFVL